jgi:WD40 repeat protein
MSNYFLSMREARLTALGQQPPKPMFKVQITDIKFILNLQVDILFEISSFISVKEFLSLDNALTTRSLREAWKKTKDTILLSSYKKEFIRSVRLRNGYLDEDKIFFCDILADGRVISFPRIGPVPCTPFRPNVNGKIKVWNSQTGKCELTLDGHNTHIKTLIELQGGRIVTAALDKVMVWNVNTGACELELQSSSEWIFSLIKLTDGRIASGGIGVIDIWDPCTGACNQQIRLILQPVNYMIELVDGRIAFGNWCSREIKICKPNEEEQEAISISHEQGSLRSLIQLADGRILIAGDAGIQIWNVETCACEVRLIDSRYTRDVIQLLDGRIASTSDSIYIKIWNVNNGACDLTLKGHSLAIYSLACCADGRIVSGGNDSTIRVWDTNTGECEVILKSDDPELNTICVKAFPDGRILSCDCKNMVIWRKLSL